MDSAKKETKCPLSCAQSYIRSQGERRTVHGKEKSGVIKDTYKETA